MNNSESINKLSSPPLIPLSSAIQTRVSFKETVEVQEIPKNKKNKKSFPWYYELFICGAMNN